MSVHIADKLANGTSRSKIIFELNYYPKFNRYDELINHSCKNWSHNGTKFIDFLQSWTLTFYKVMRQHNKGMVGNVYSSVTNLITNAEKLMAMVRVAHFFGVSVVFDKITKFISAWSFVIDHTKARCSCRCSGINDAPLCHSGINLVHFRESQGWAGALKWGLSTSI